MLGFAAFSGTGKTTLLTQLIPALKSKGLRIGLIKHSHHDFEIDQPGKDSFRLRAAGASPVMLVSKYRRAIITEFSQSVEPALQEQIKFFEHAELDLILVEGFRDECFPKIELHRLSLGNSLLYPNDTNIIAIASDVAMNTPAHLINLDINQPDEIANFIHQHFFQNHD
jgi:molybdopterin-guanine dinucleotide biosynthesis protein B